MEAVRPAEQRGHRQERHHLRRRHPVERAGNKGFKQGIRIGSIKDGKVTAFIPVPSEAIGTPEGITVDDQGIIYGGYTAKMNLRRFVKK